MKGPLSLLLIPVMAVLNRASGMDEWFPGRNIYATGILTGLAAGFLTGSWYFGLLCALAMYCYRLPGWYKTLDIGTHEGNPVQEALFMGARSMFMAAPFMIAGVFNDTVIQALVACAVGSAGCMMGYTVAWHTPIRKIHPADPIIAAELLAGASLGVAFWLLSAYY